MDLRDIERAPLPAGVEGFMRREVLPYAPDAWHDASKAKIGYEISFNRYFYKPEPLRALGAVGADISALRREGEGLLAGLVGGE